MMDEQLIAEVEQHGVIYNRQKYSINNLGGPGGGGGGGSISGTGVNKYETKEEAWQIIAIKLQTDVEACKKRWKYLRERYVSQRKQGDPPVYEHLSRPYLEKMKFLDQHIQPRKSYRNVSNFLTSPSTNSSFVEYNMDSSKSNGSLKNLSFPVHQPNQQPQSAVYQQEGTIKTENDQSFRDFAAAVASQQLHQLNSLHPQFNPTTMCPNNNSNNSSAAMASTTDTYDQYRENEHHAHNVNSGPTGNGIPSSTSSSMKSPLSSSPSAPPPAIANNNVSSELSDDQQFISNGSNNMKKPRVQMTGQYLDTSDSDDNLSPAPAMHHSSMMNDTHSSSSNVHPSHQQQQHLQQQQQQQHYNKMLSNVARNMTNMSHAPSSATSAGLFPTNNDFLFSLYQQMTPGVPPQQERNLAAASASPIRSSEHLLGELVTSELLKMNKERRKTVQKRILEILFFED